MSITWVVQDNLGSTSSTAGSIQRACEMTGQNYVPIQVVPFSQALPEMPCVEGKFVLYGRTTLILAASADEYWKDGVFFNPDTFTPKSYLDNWGEKMLNFDASLIKMRDVEQLRYPACRELFVRPNDDLKMLSGGVITFEQLCQMYDNATEDLNEPINLNTELVIASKKMINREWRLFVVDGNIVAGSQYIPDVRSFIPDEVMQFAKSAIEIWSPDSVFVMDIAEDNENLKIIECNCFNGSGHYASNLEHIVHAVSKYMELVQ